jgi:hypothetical protein
MGWLRTERITLATALSPAECVQRLSAATKPVDALPWRRWPLAGEVSAAGFRLRRGDPRVYQSPTSPLAVGQFRPSANGTEIEVVLRPLTSPFGLFWSLLVAFGMVGNALVVAGIGVKHVFFGDGVAPAFWFVLATFVGSATMMARWLLPFGDAEERALLLTRLRRLLDAEGTNDQAQPTRIGEPARLVFGIPLLVVAVPLGWFGLAALAQTQNGDANHNRLAFLLVGVGLLVGAVSCAMLGTVEVGWTSRRRRTQGALLIVAGLAAIVAGVALG